MSASHAAEETHEHAHKILNKMRPSICTRFQNTENLEAKTSLKLQRWLKNASFPKILTTVVYVPLMEKFAIAVTENFAGWTNSVG